MPDKPVDAFGENNPQPAFPTVDEVQHVDAERIESESRYRYGQAAPHYHSANLGGAHVHVFQSHAAMSMLKPPTIATWACLIIAWFFLGSKVPFTVFLGVPFDLAALLLATVCLSRGGVFTGIFVLLLGTLGSFIVYLVGLFRFLAIG